jgi:hypothetical protein
MTGSVERNKNSHFENKYLLKDLSSSVSMFLGYSLMGGELWVPLWAGTDMFPSFTLSNSSLGLGTPPMERGPGEIWLQ